jgi:DNA-binding NarL/FixJ family response regulator
MCHPPQVAGTPLRVVIAEDDGGLAELMRSVLDGDRRFTVVGLAPGGDEAVELAGELHPDIVVMDIAMPTCDGIEATRMIHELDANQHVVIYTGSEEYEDVARAEAAGASGFLHKEALTSPALADALYVLHENHRQARANPE